MTERRFRHVDGFYDQTESVVFNSDGTVTGHRKNGETFDLTGPYYTIEYAADNVRNGVWEEDGTVTIPRDIEAICAAVERQAVERQHAQIEALTGSVRNLVEATKGIAHGIERIEKDLGGPR